MIFRDLIESRRRNWQISLASLFYMTTACALVAALTARLGSIVIAGLIVASTVGIACGAPIGFIRGRTLAACVASLIGATLAVGVHISMLVERSITFGEWDRLRTYHLATFLLYYPILIRFVGIAFMGAWPLACVGAAYDRRGAEVIIFPMFMCGSAAFFVGLLFFAYGVWIRGGFPQPPLPWPIALAISLGCAVFVAALAGLAAGLIWLVVRSAWQYVCSPLDASLSNDHRVP